MKALVTYYRPMKGSKSEPQKFPDLAHNKEEAGMTERFLRFHDSEVVETREEEVTAEQIAEHNKRGVLPPFDLPAQVGG